MCQFVPAFVPADGVVEAAITIAVMVIAFIGWLVQIVGQSRGPKPGPVNRPRPAAPRPAAAAPNRPRPQGNDRLQSEIDAFLREVATGRKPEPVEEDAIEIIEDDVIEDRPRRLAPAPTSLATPQAPVNTGQITEWDREQQRRRERMISTLGERHLEATPLGADLRKHVEQYMSESVQLRREKEQVEQRLAETRAELQAMRAQTAAGPAAAPVGGRAAGSGTSRFSNLLKNRRSVKDAIVINEVLGRPKGMTRRG